MAESGVPHRGEKRNSGSGLHVTQDSYATSYASSPYLCKAGETGEAGDRVPFGSGNLENPFAEHLPAGLDT